MESFDFVWTIQLHVVMCMLFQQHKYAPFSWTQYYNEVVQSIFLTYIVRKALKLVLFENQVLVWALPRGIPGKPCLHLSLWLCMNGNFVFKSCYILMMLFFKLTDLCLMHFAREWYGYSLQICDLFAQCLNTSGCEYSI